MFGLLTEIGVTAQQWREMSSEDTLWYISAHSEKNRRVNQANRKAENLRKAKSNLAKTRRR